MIDEINNITKNLSEKKEQYYKACDEAYKEFKKLYEKKIVKINFKFYTELQLCIDDNHRNCNHSISGYELLDNTGNLGAWKKFHNSDLHDIEIVDINEIKDNSFKLDGKSLTDLKLYLEAIGYDTRAVHKDNSCGYQKITAMPSNGELELNIKTVWNKSEGNKFNTIYNMMKKFDLVKKPIIKITYDKSSYKPEPILVTRVSYNKEKDILNFV